ncbi:hypothetical protein JSO19_07420 [Leucobacter sp. UCMA 4100]|uniref:hypothetical protein n=1 Tax=Leucobacter sp. UCMA 4100 TaxID=2810534 RepID=UPI0022EB717E|nr:hypothetical protein [Leucobacter sp. UCMA 4100]MDA3147207.1 hypothetical protein [Leucobacter sp. UCMA 4100]
MNALEQYIADRLTAGASGAAIEGELLAAGWSVAVVQPVIHAQLARARQLAPRPAPAAQATVPGEPRNGEPLLITSLVLLVAAMVPFIIMFFVPFWQSATVEAATAAVGEMAIMMLFLLPVSIALWIAAFVCFLVAKSGGRMSRKSLSIWSIIMLFVSPVVTATFFTLAILFATIVGVMCGTTVSPGCGIL